MRSLMLKTWVRPLIQFSMKFPSLLVIATWLVVAVAAWQVAQLGRNFLPAFDEGSVQVNVTLPPGSSLQASNQVSTNIVGAGAQWFSGNSQGRVDRPKVD